MRAFEWNVLISPRHPFLSSVSARDGDDHGRCGLGFRRGWSQFLRRMQSPLDCHYSHVDPDLQVLQDKLSSSAKVYYPGRAGSRIRQHGGPL
ncbi:hypothetical protein N7497_003845 [Penicillium chrysogenum]|jgi:hypothetical protein|nr:hypothetical protein N7497_003845 [Penicillium chrysogenum]